MYCKAATGGPNYGHRDREDRSSGSRDMLAVADRQTDKLIAILCSPIRAE